MKAILITATGGPEVMEYREVAPPAQRTDDDILIDVDVAGVNYIDTYFRAGTYPRALPQILGQEGAGRVVDDPAGLIAPGTFVAWAEGPGSYAEQVVVPRDRLVAVPDSVPAEVAASMLLQGMTAHFLIHGVWDLDEGDSCLLTGGAGGVGLLATQFAAAAGISVFSVVSTPKKAELALAAGAADTLGYDEDFGAWVRAHNGGTGVDVAFDGVGRATFANSLGALRRRGLMCLFGAASGPVGPIDPQELNRRGSLFLTRPTLADYVATVDEFRMRAQAVVSAVTEGRIAVSVGKQYSLADAAAAHRDLQSRATTGSLVLRVR